MRFYFFAEGKEIEILDHTDHDRRACCDADLIGALRERLEIRTVCGNGASPRVLREAGASGRPVLLKRGMMTTIAEWLNAAEYVLSAGGRDLVFCERGIRTFEPALRNTLDIGSVAVLRDRTHLPVIVDPSHAAGLRRLVVPLARAAVAAGADGLIVECHPRPEEARCDKDQALDEGLLAELSTSVAALCAALGRSTCCRISVWVSIIALPPILRAGHRNAPRARRAPRRQERHLRRPAARSAG